MHKANSGSFKKGHKLSPLWYELMKTRKPWNKGLKKEDDERIMRSSIRMTNNNPSKRQDVRDKVSKALTGRKMPPEFGREQSKRMKGKTPKNLPQLLAIDRRGLKNPIHKVAKEKLWSWKGGITPLVQKIRHCYKYVEWRKNVFSRDDYACQKCGKRGTYIEADHFPKSFSDIFRDNNIKNIEEALDCKDFWDIDNGRTLCKKCHNPTRGKRTNKLK